MARAVTPLAAPNISYCNVQQTKVVLVMLQAAFFSAGLVLVAALE